MAWRRQSQPPAPGLGARLMMEEEWANRPLGGWAGEMAPGAREAPAPGPPLLVEAPDWTAEGADGDVATPDIPPVIFEPPPWKVASGEFEPHSPLHLEAPPRFTPPEPDWEAELREQHEREHGPEVGTLEEAPRRHPPPRRLPAS